MNNTEDIDKPNSGKSFWRVVRWPLYLLAGLLAFLFLIILLLRIPRVQQEVTNYAASYFTKKTGASASIDRLLITFDGQLWIQGLYIEDLEGDTLIYFQNLEAGIAVQSLFDNEVHLTNFSLDGLKANIHRKSDKPFNYQFIMEAFKPEKKPEDPDEIVQWLIAIPKLRITQSDITFYDSQAGYDIQLSMNSLVLGMNPFTTNKTSYAFKHLSLSGLKTNIEQWEVHDNKATIDSSVTNQSNDSLIFKLGINKLALDTINFRYHHRENGTITDIVLGHNQSQDIELVLGDPRTTGSKLTTSDFYQSGVVIYLANPKEISIKEEINTNQNNETNLIQPSFKWPEWTIDLGKISLINHQLTITNPKASKTPGVFNAHDMDLRVDSLFLTGLTLKNHKLLAEINQLKGSEQSGIELTHLQLKLEANDQLIAVTELDAQTIQSKVLGDASITYENLGQFIHAPGQNNIILNLPQIRIAPKDILYFAPDLAKDTLLGPLLKNMIYGSITSRGTLDQLLIQQFDAQFGTNTQIKFNGTVNALTEPDKLSFNLKDVHLYSVIKDFQHFVPKDSSYTLPDFVQLDGIVSGTTKKIKSTYLIHIPEGELAGNIIYNNLKTQPIYNGTLHIKSLNAARYTDSIAPEMIKGNLYFDGKGFSPYTMAVDIKSDFSSLILKGTEYGKIQLNGKIKESQFNLDGNINNEHLALTLLGQGILDSLFPSFDVAIQLSHLDMQALGYSEDDIQMKTSIAMTGKGGATDFKGNISMTGFEINREDKSYYMDSLTGNLAYNNKSTIFDLNSPILNAHLNANVAPEMFIKGISNHIQSYLEEGLPPLPISNDMTADLVVDIPETDFIRHILLPGLERMEDLHLTMQFNQKEKSLEAQWTSPYLFYKDIELHGLKAAITSNMDSLNYVLNMDGLISGPLDIRATKISGNLNNNHLVTTIDISDETHGKLIDITLDGEKINETYLLKVNPKNIVFNNQAWAIPPQNSILYTPKYLEIKEFEFSRGQTSFRLESHPAEKTDFLNLVFNQIALDKLIAFLNPDNPVASGTMNGTITLAEIFHDPILGANLNIKNLEAIEIVLGDLDAQIANNDASVYEGEVKIMGPDLDVNLDGIYDMSQEGKASFTGTMNLNKLALSLLGPISKSYIKDAEGQISGYVEAGNKGGTIAYKGNLNMESIAFNLLETGSTYRIPSEKVNFSHENIVFDQFLISDNAGHPTVLDGVVNITNLLNPGFNLTINSRDFKLLESTRENNELIFGKAIVDLNIKLTGTKNSPVVRSNIQIKDGSDVTFIIPETQIDLVEREGVVIFESRVDGKVLTQRDTILKQPTGYLGTDLQSIIKVDPKAVFQIIIDESAGDKLVVSGAANLSFDMSTRGKMTLSGRYELRDGYYEMRLYEIVRRRFNLQPGSELTWSGDPLGADIDIQAIYQAKSSALDLMADQLSGADATVKTQYRQELPFNVHLNMKGTLLKPALSFGIDMPESARSALGGQVYNRIQQLNEMDSEKNTQVFSLLVLGRFLPQGSTSDAAGKIDAGAMARTSASRMLSGQLNALSDRFIKGVDLDLDLESFTDYQSGQAEDRTKLNVRLRQNLFNDRLQVQVGGQVDLEGSSATEEQRPTDLLGDMSIEYSLTKQADWRLRAFRKNQAEGLIDGQIIVNGFSVLFNRDFNTFQELMRRTKKEKKADLITKDPEE